MSSAWPRFCSSSCSWLIGAGGGLGFGSAETTGFVGSVSFTGCGFGSLRAGSGACTVLVGAGAGVAFAVLFELSVCAGAEPILSGARIGSFAGGVAWFFVLPPLEPD